MVNWLRIASNGGVSFCTGFIAALGAGLTENAQFRVATLTAVTQGFLTFFIEMKRESENEDKYTKTPVKPSMAVLL
jgi:hypothetical protein